MSAMRYSLSLLLCISSLLCAAQSEPQRQKIAISEDSVQLVQIGVRCYPDGSQLPIWAVMMGDTGPAERVARGYSGFGPYSLDATLWTRAEDMPHWVRTTYRRPQNPDEAVNWFKDREPFTSRLEGDSGVLPAQFAILADDLIGKVDFIIRYNDGTAKAYLFAGTSTDDAERIVKALTAGNRAASQDNTGVLWAARYDAEMMAVW